MIDIFDEFYGKLANKNGILTKLKLYSILRVVVRVFANILLPLYLFLTRNDRRYEINKVSSKEQKVIVSLTSFPSRTKRVWLVIESLLHQSKKPDKIILWLSKKQYSGRNELPKVLLDLEKRGLEIKFVEADLKSHKKYYYALLRYPNDIIITVDDDVFYHSKLIESLHDLHVEYPHCICCNHAVKIVKIDAKIVPYKEWGAIRTNYGPSGEIMPIGVGGILYPPNILYKDVLQQKIFKSNCLYADDIWLNAMTRLNGATVVRSGFKSRYLPIKNYRDSPLHEKNNKDGGNDIQIKNIVRYYKKNNLFPF
jgi:hypothetical protein